MPSTIEADVQAAITAALGSGNNGLASSLAQLLHIGSTTQGLDFSKKTMTTTWYQANETTAITLVAAGWTIIPG